MPTTAEPQSPLTSPSLIGRAANGDAIAWQRIVQLYGPLVYAWTRRSGLQPFDAADATQDTFLSVAQRLSSFDHDRPGATFRGWLWTIARNKAADQVRRAECQAMARGGSTNLQHLQALSQAESEDYASDRNAHAQDDQAAVVRRALALMRTSFEPTTWQAFWRTVVDGLSPDEVAAELSMSRWSVYKARSRVLQLLRSELSGLESLP